MHEFSYFDYSVSHVNLEKENEVKKKEHLASEVSRKYLIFTKYIQIFKTSKNE